MKKILLLFSLLLSQKLIAQSTIISPSGASENNLKANSATKGIVIPRMTTKKILQITNPVKGTIIYDTDRKLLKVFSGFSWEVLKPKGTPLYPI